MPRIIPLNLNDSIRMQSWQKAMPNFEDWQTDLLQNKAIHDYLACYGLDAITSNAYQAGYRQIGDYRIFQQMFVNTPKSEMVMIVHGYTDHAGLFAKVIRYLFSEGYSVCVFDLPGHGLSSGERATIPHFSDYLTVLKSSIAFFQERVTTKVPMHIVAQSLGGGLTMNYLIQNKVQKHELGNIVLLAPLVRPKAWVQANYAYPLLNKVIDSIPRTASRNSEDEVFTQFARFGDPVQHDRLPGQWVGAMLEWNKTFEMLLESQFPLTVIQGDKDETVDWIYNPPFIQKKFPNTTLHFITGAGHHLAGESDRIQEYVFAYMKEALAR